MAPFKHFFSSQIGKKIIMSLSGFALIGFLVVHLIGNLLVFGGSELYNHYSHKLISNPVIVVAELILLAIFIGHFLNGIILTFRNRSARGKSYKLKRGADHTSRKSLSSTTMILSGIVILIFVPIHLWGFKYGPFYTSTVDPAVRDLYRLVMEEFQEPGEVIWYVAAMAILGFHLWHAFGSAFESLGFRYRKTTHRIGHALAVILATGFAIIPLIIFLKKGQL